MIYLHTHTHTIVHVYVPTTVYSAQFNLFAFRPSMAVVFSSPEMYSITSKGLSDQRKIVKMKLDNAYKLCPDKARQPVAWFSGAGSSPPPQPLEL